MEKDSIISYLRNFFREKGENYQISLAFLFGSLATGITKKIQTLILLFYLRTSH